MQERHQVNGPARAVKDASADIRDQQCNDKSNATSQTTWSANKSQPNLSLRSSPANVNRRAAQQGNKPTWNTSPTCCMRCSMAALCVDGAPAGMINTASVDRQQTTGDKGCRAVGRQAMEVQLAVSGGRQSISVKRLAPSWSAGVRAPELPTSLMLPAVCSMSPARTCSMASVEWSSCG